MGYQSDIFPSMNPSGIIVEVEITAIVLPVHASV
ncbi:hypothetical protein BX589_128114 [Paraburkholderia fungorum]|jgi:hypothetical protein|nr:hypothetical protein BX589_128114 [Paraburkholderia fungorum]